LAFQFSSALPHSPAFQWRSGAAPVALEASVRGRLRGDRRVVTLRSGGGRSTLFLHRLLRRHIPIAGCHSSRRVAWAGTTARRTLRPLNPSLVCGSSGYAPRGISRGGPRQPRLRLVSDRCRSNRCHAIRADSRANDPAGADLGRRARARGISSAWDVAAARYCLRRFRARRSYSLFRPFCNFGRRSSVAPGSLLANLE
jgi:hypothetical protein